MNQNYSDNDSRADSYQSVGSQPEDNIQNGGSQASGNNADNGYQSSDNSPNNSYQSNDSYMNNGGQSNDSYTNNSYQSSSNYPNNGYSNNAYSGYQNNYQPYGNMPPYTDNQLELEEPVKISEWVLALVLMMIPCVNIIMMFVWAFSSTEKKSKSNFFKAYLIFFAIGLALAVLIWIGIIFFAALALS